MNRASLALLSLLLLPSATWADSWCGFDQGFIGTQAVGYVFPGSLEGYVAPDTTKQPISDPICKVQTYASPGGKALKTFDCTEFQHTPSYYVDDPSAFEPPAVPLPSNEYFTLMIFATKDRFVQLRLKDNTPTWAKMGDSWFIHEIGQDGVYPPDQIFEKPDRTSALSPLKAMDNDKTIQAKIRAMFKGTHYDASKTDAVALLRNPDIERRGSFFADFVYVGQGEVIGVDGTRWLKAEERFQWDWSWTDHLNKPPKPDKKYALSTDEYENQFRTEPLRTVYIPLRDVNGTLLNVADYGYLYCD